jgi:hypothetical protein
MARHWTPKTRSPKITCWPDLGSAARTSVSGSPEFSVEPVSVFSIACWVRFAISHLLRLAATGWPESSAAASGLTNNMDSRFEGSRGFGRWDFGGADFRLGLLQGSPLSLSVFSITCWVRFAISHLLRLVVTGWPESSAAASGLAKNMDSPVRG